MAVNDSGAGAERIFRELVRALKERDAALLGGPIQISAIYQDIVPYRTHRDVLGFDTIEDYETALLALLAGAYNYVTVHPPEAQEALAAEAAAVNPDLSAYRAYAAAAVRINPQAVRNVEQPDEAYAPPEAKAERPVWEFDEPPAAPTPEPKPEPEPVRASVPGVSAVCRNCGHSLPLHRQVVYCPFCGKLAGTPVCARCGAELEIGWRFCVECGAPAPHRASSAGTE